MVAMTKFIVDLAVVYGDLLGEGPTEVKGLRLREVIAKLRGGGGD